MYLEKACDRVNREALWQVPRMYDVSDKLLNGIKRMYVNSSACVRIKGGERECSRFDSGGRQGCIMSPWLFKVYMDAMMKEVEMGVERRGESGYCLASCMQMTWLYVVSRRKI